MKTPVLRTATVALLSLTLVSIGAEQSKKKGPFAVADTDGDGKISQAEYLAAMKGKVDESAARAKFAELDKDKNGSLSREEFAAGAGEKKGGRKKKETN